MEEPTLKRGRSLKHQQSADSSDPCSDNSTHFDTWSKEEVINTITIL